MKSNSSIRIVIFGFFVTTSVFCACSTGGMKMPDTDSDSSAGISEKALTKRNFLKLFLYQSKDVDDYLSGASYGFARYDPELGSLQRSRQAREGIDGSTCIYTFDDIGPRRTIMHADKPCRINVYGSSYAMGEQVGDAETWQEFLAAHLCEPIRNFGVGGYSLYGTYLRMEKEEQHTPSDLVVLDLTPGDHFMNLLSWQRLFFRNDTDKAFHTTMPYVKADPATGNYQECSNPCPTPQSLYRLCDLDWVYETFHDDFLLNLIMSDPEVRRIATQMLEQYGDGNYRDSDDTFMPALINTHKDPRFKEVGLFASTRIMKRFEDFSASSGKKILFVLSYGPLDVEAYLKTKERPDQVFYDYLIEHDLPFVDMLAIHAVDYEKFDLDHQDYLDRYFIHHNYHPAGNMFKAYHIKNKLVEMLDPKPEPY